jgi:hypothetical protein
VPLAALIATTAAASSSVSFSAATASGFEAACQKPCHPPPIPFAARAASGIRTTTLR